MFIPESRVLHLISAEEEFLKVPCFHKMKIVCFKYEQTLELVLVPVKPQKV